MAAIDRCIADYAALRIEFSANEVRAKLGLPASSESNNAIGAAFGRASRMGLIECVGLTASDEPSRKGGGIRVWRGVDPNQTRLEL